jgi:hypothetical protein
MKRTNEKKTPIGDLRLDIPRGVYKNVTFMNKFGLLPTMDSADAPTDLWEHGALLRDYPFPEWGTAPIERIVSDNVNDFIVTIAVYGLDLEGNEVIQTVELTGTAPILLDTPLWRVYRMVNVSPNPTTGQGRDLQGVVTAFEGDQHAGGVPPADKVRAMILNGNNQTQMAIYTVPKGKTAYFTDAGTGLAKGGGTTSTAVVAIYARKFPMVFTIQKTISLVSTGSSNFANPLSVFLVATELTDIKLKVESVSANGTGIWGSFTMILVDETEEAKQ